jgi:uncharacterized membrane protein YdbT with pleckstrin-like domain
MDIILKPTAVFAFIKTCPWLIGAILMMYLANCFSPLPIWFSLIGIVTALYRYLYIRRCSYLVTGQYIRITQGILFKRICTVELFRVKDYIILEPFLLQLFRLMDLQLKTTDPENPMLWLRGIPQSDIVEIVRERVLETRKHNQIVEIN